MCADRNENTDYHQLAVNANEYARSVIFIGSTQVENNSLELEQFEALDKAIFNTGREIELLIEQSLWLDRKVSRHDADVQVSRKYSLGNCAALAHMAFEYLLENHPNINAEICNIIGAEVGYHEFLVVGRKPGSDSSDPSTWGDDAYFCDPWANKVYPASEYQTKLKGYSSDQGEAHRENRATDLAGDYMITPDQYMTTEYFRNLNNNTRLVSAQLSRYRDAIYDMQKSLDIYSQALLSQHRRCLKKYGPNSEEERLLQNKLESLAEFTDKLQAMLDKIDPTNPQDSNYLEMGRIFEFDIRELKQNLRNICRFNARETSIISALYEYDVRSASLFGLFATSRPQQPEGVAQINRAIAGLNRCLA